MKFWEGTTIPRGTPTPDEAMEMAQEIIDAMPESDEKIAAQMMHDELVGRRERIKNG